MRVLLIILIQVPFVQIQPERTAIAALLGTILPSCELLQKKFLLRNYIFCGLMWLLLGQEVVSLLDHLISSLVMAPGFLECIMGCRGNIQPRSLFATNL